MAIDVYLKAGSAARKLILEVVPQPYHGELTEHYPVKKTDIPAKATWVLHCGKGKPSMGAEWFAAQKASLLACLPEAMDWVQGGIANNAENGNDMVILDAALHKIQAVV